MKIDVPLHDDRTHNLQLMQRERLTESLMINDTCDVISAEDRLSLVDEVNRSTQCLFSMDTLFRYLSVRCLVETESSSPNHDELIKLLLSKHVLTPDEIEILKEKYSPQIAIQLYTRYDFIYKELNTALRSAKLLDLIAFRYILRGIYEQLRDNMVHKSSNLPMTLYRGQAAEFYEIIGFFNIFQQQVPLMITSFFSTSHDRATALGFIRSGSDGRKKTHLPVLFQIDVRQEDTSLYYPFADISGFSEYNEEEVLFSPGQLFTITNFEIVHDFIHGNETYLYKIEMNLYNQADTILDSIYSRLKNEGEGKNHVSLIHLARIAQNYDRNDEAKEIYLRLLEQTNDQETQIACYNGLSELASHKCDDDEMIFYKNKKFELQFGTRNALSNTTVISISKENAQQVGTLENDLRAAQLQVSLSLPLENLVNFTVSDELRNTASLTQKFIFDAASSCATDGNQGLAIMLLEQLLATMNTVFGSSPFTDHLLKSKCYMKIGHCYHELEQYEKALQHYTLALNSDISLPLEVYAEVMIGTGSSLERSNQFEGALAKYTELAERYQNETIDPDSDDVRLNEERVERVLSYILPLDS